MVHKFTHKSRARRKSKMMVKVKALQSVLSLMGWVLLPPQLPQQRQQQKHSPVMQNAMAPNPPMSATMISPTHHGANCRERVYSNKGCELRSWDVRC